MSYTKTTWSDGDVITAEKLNKLEDGIANAALMIIINGTVNSDGVIVLDKTWQEIYGAVNNKIPVYICYNYNNSDDDYGVVMEEVRGVIYINNKYTVNANNSYYADSLSDYPTSGEGAR